MKQLPRAKKSLCRQASEERKESVTEDVIKIFLIDKKISIKK